MVGVGFRGARRQSPVGRLLPRRARAARAHGMLPGLGRASNDTNNTKNTNNTSKIMVIIILIIMIIIINSNNHAPDGKKKSAPGSLKAGKVSRKEPLVSVALQTCINRTRARFETDVCTTMTG